MAAGLAICPSLDATLLDAEDEHRAALNHGATLELVQTASDAGYHTAPCGLYEAECVGGGVDVAAEWAGGSGVRVGHGGDVVRFATSRGLALITDVDKTGSKEDDACMANLLACVLSYDQRHLEISAPTNEKGTLAISREACTASTGQRHNHTRVGVTRIHTRLRSVARWARCLSPSALAGIDAPAEHHPPRQHNRQSL